MPTHTVKQGEHLSGIARQYGFRHYKTIWEHAQNKALRDKRKDPHVLYPEDLLYIPEKQERNETRPAGDLHTFKVKGKRLMLNLALRDFNDDPIANTPCTLTIDKQTYKLTTDGDGRISQQIAPTAHEGMLSYGQTRIQLLIGDLDPVEESSGWRERLNNMGYFAGTAGDPDDMRIKSAVEQFQCDCGLTVDGDCGPQTQTELHKAHGA